MTIRRREVERIGDGLKFAQGYELQGEISLQFRHNHSWRTLTRIKTYLHVDDLRGQTRGECLCAGSSCVARSENRDELAVVVVVCKLMVQAGVSVPTGV